MLFVNLEQLVNKMKKVPDFIRAAWNDRKGAVVFCTASPDAIPNAIYVKSVSFYSEDKILIANNYFDKTMQNILSGSMGAVLFITQDDKSYQLKGTIEYQTEGDLFNEMKSWNPARHPGIGVVILTVNEIYNGGIKLL